MDVKEMQSHLETVGANTHPSEQNLREKLLVHKTYLLTSGVGLISPLIIVYLYSAGESMLEFILFFVIIIISGSYLFYAFGQLLIEQFDFQKIRFPMRLFLYSLGADMGLIILFLLVYGHHPLNYDPANVSFLEMAGYYAALLTAFALSTSFIMMSFELESLSHNLYGLLKPLRYALLTLSLFLLISTLATINSYLSQVPLLVGISFLTIIISDILLLLSLTINCLLISLVFLFFVLRDVVPAATS